MVIDPRAGSKTLIEPLRALGVEVQVEQLAAGDVAWLGWLDGEQVAIGVEHKQISDALACIATGRFAGKQLIDLQQDYRVFWLLLQGRHREGQHGELLVHRKGQWEAPAGGGRGGWTYREFEHWLSTMRHLGGVRVKQVDDLAGSCAWLRAEATWWAKRRHSSHEAFDMSQALVRPSMLRRVAACLPGIGHEKSAAVSRAMGSVEGMLRATPAEWSEVPGVGKVLSERIWRALRNGSGA